MIKKLLFVFVFILGSLTTAQAAKKMIAPNTNGVLFVKKNVVGGDQSGSSWANAMTELADALKMAKEMNDVTAGTVKEIWVAAGTYKPKYSPEDGVNFGTNKGRNNSFLLVKNVKLYGGLAGTETTVDADTPTAGESILSGDFNGNDIITGSGTAIVFTNNTENAYHVLLSVGDVGTAQITNFTITGGFANGVKSSNLTVNTIAVNRAQGAGFSCFASSPTVTNCSFVRNKAVDAAGAFVNNNSKGSFKNCSFSENLATENGGGLCIKNSSTSVFDCNFTSNKSELWSGGMACYNSPSIISGSKFISNVSESGGGLDILGTTGSIVINCLFKENSSLSSLGGGGVLYEGSKGTIVNCNFSLNTSKAYGGGLYVYKGSVLELVNSTLCDNTAATNGGGVYFDNTPATTKLKILNSIVFGNKNGTTINNIYNKKTAPEIQYSLIEGNLATTNGNLDATGMTMASIFANPAAGDYSLKTASPAINKGSNALFPNLNLTTSTDLAGNLRVKGTAIDMGAYEFTPPLEATQSQTDVVCTGATTGVAAVVASGGVTPYTYLWNNGATNASITGITNGNYSVKITDAANTAITKDFTILVTDTEKPVVRTKNASLTLDASGQATLTVADIDNGSTDNCGILSRVLSKITFDASDIGDTSVTLTVTDVNGNVNTNTAVVTIPFVCPGNIVIANNDAGACGAIVNYEVIKSKSKVLILGADEPSHMLDVQQKLLATNLISSVDIINMYVATPTLSQLKAYDAVLVYTNYTAVDQTTTGNVLAQYIDGGGGVVDAVFENASISLQGAYNTALYRVIVPSYQKQYVELHLGTVVIPTHPIMKDVLTFSAGRNSFVASSPTLSPGSYAVANYHTNEILIAAKENVGAQQARRASLNFFPPSSDARPDFWEATTDGAKIMANALNWVAKKTINVNSVQTAGLPSGSLFPVGTTVNSFELTDKNGVVHNCSFTVTVNDSEKPVVKTKNFTAQLNAAGTVTISAKTDIDNNSTDNCTIASYTLDKDTFDCSNVGANTVTLTVTDVNGNSDTATAVVTVEDKIKPVVKTKNFTAKLNAAGTVTISAETDINIGSTDNCTIASYALDKDTFDCSNVGANTVTLTVTDVNGNSDNATAVVTVEDKIIPVAITKSFTAQLNAAGTVTISAENDIDNNSTDNCTIASYTLDKDTFDCSNVGANTVTLTVTDVNGNSDTATAVVTVEDKIKPVVKTKNFTAQLNAAGTVTISAKTDIDNGSTDNCTIASYTLDKDTFDCSNVGANPLTNTVTLTVTDVNGNSNTATAVVTVEDKIIPVAITKSFTAQLNAAGTVTISAETDINNNSTDNCTIASYALDKDTFDCSNVGANTVILTITDVNGNSNTATAVVTVEDKIIPMAITKNFTAQLNAAGTVTISAENDINNNSTDNCTIASYALDKDTFDCSNVGANTVTLTVTDVNGNSNTATAVVTVEDKIIPVAITKSFTAQLNAAGKVTISAENDIDNNSTDNCTIASYALDKDTFDCSNVGANTVILTITDVNGNSNTATAVVTVEDKINPVAITKNFTAQLNAAGTVTISAENDIDNNSTDNCTIARYTLDKDTFDCSNVGANTVTLTVTDVAGNSDTATALVTVEDKINPVAITKSFTAQLNAAGTVTISAENDINNNSTDNCTIASYTLDKDTFDCSNVGANTVMLTVTDVAGNSDTATAVVTVEDKINPVAITKNFTAQLNAAGTVTISAKTDIDNGSTDNCTIASYALDKDTFDCSNVGANTVTLTVTDVAGNSNTATAVITVEDKINPVAKAQDITVQLDASGTVTIAERDIDMGSTDNCGIKTYTLDKKIFGCADIGTNTVQLTVADAAGNTDFATATVTILPLPAPIVNNTHQLFCAEEQARISDIEIVGSGLEWYTSDTSTVVVSPTTLLGTGTYYVATRYGNCYSNRTAVTITVNDTAPPTGNNIQFSCLENPATVASLVTNETEVLWYSSAIGGQPLSATTILEDQQFYYASYVGGDCESSQRFAVQVTVRHCDVNVFNAVSANNDGKNDYLQLGGISEFPDNTVEIFNQWGQLVFKTKQYGAVNDNVFRGYANVGTNQKSGTVLPFGTYYYVIQFVNHDKQNIQKSGYLHLNN